MEKLIKVKCKSLKDFKKDNYFGSVIIVGNGKEIGCGSFKKVPNHENAVIMYSDTSSETFFIPDVAYIIDLSTVIEALKEGLEEEIEQEAFKESAPLIIGNEKYEWEDINKVVEIKGPDKRETIITKEDEIERHVGKGNFSLWKAINKINVRIDSLLNVIHKQLQSNNIHQTLFEEAMIESGKRIKKIITKAVIEANNPDKIYFWRDEALRKQKIGKLKRRRKFLKNQILIKAKQDHKVPCEWFNEFNNICDELNGVN